MNIAEIIEGLNEWIADRGPAEFVSGQLIQVQLGAEYSVTHTNGSPPIIVAYPDTDGFSQPHDPGSVPNDPRGRGRGNPKSIRDVTIVFQFECWGIDFDATERLRNLLVRAFHQMTEPHFTLGVGKWNRDTKLAALGRLYTIAVGVRCPVLAVPQKTVQVAPKVGPAPEPGTQTNMTAGVELEAGASNPEPPIDVST